MNSYEDLTIDVDAPALYEDVGSPRSPCYSPCSPTYSPTSDWDVMPEIGSIEKTIGQIQWLFGSMKCRPGLVEDVSLMKQIFLHEDCKRGGFNVDRSSDYLEAVSFHGHLITRYYAVGSNGVKVEFVVSCLSSCYYKLDLTCTINTHVINTTIYYDDEGLRQWNCNPYAPFEYKIICYEDIVRQLFN